MNTAHEPHQKWIKSLPRSKMRYPTSLRDRAKYVFWRTYTPLHPLVRVTARALGLDTDTFVETHEGRQKYPLGYIAPEVPLKEFVEHLLKEGFAKFHVAWKDEGEVISLRRVENFTHQYHIRIFTDGEIRGHYEYTPECFPFAHLRAVGQEPRAEFFTQLFGDKAIAQKH